MAIRVARLTRELSTPPPMRHEFGPFFVHPDAARQGIGSAFLRAAEEAIRSEGFQRIVMAATLPGEALYARHGYEVEERYEIMLDGEITLPLVRMAKSLTSEPS